MLLADLGAEVTKIEVPGQGDPFRGWGDNAYSPVFRSLNRNKNSLTLNIQSRRGPRTSTCGLPMMRMR